jgi:hypothetical protein
MDHARFSVFEVLQDGSRDYLKESASLDVAVETFAASISKSPSQVIICDERIGLSWELKKGLSRL